MALLPRLPQQDPFVVGALHSSVPGRTDNLKISVPEGAYVIPADIVSALGQGNTTAGLKLLEELLPRKDLQLMAKGGKVPIAAAGGEYVVSPDAVAALGGGDIKKGHDFLDKFVVKTRNKTINHLKRLPRPEK